MEQFLDVLKGHIELELELADTNPGEEMVYIDRERLKGGYLFNEALDKAVCYSVCMIVIFTSTYFSKNKTFCSREYLAMQRLEEERKALLQDKKFGLIIPIVLTGKDVLPPELTGKRQFYDFTGCIRELRDVRSDPIYRGYIAEIAEYIRQLHDDLMEPGADPCADCENHKLPDDDDNDFKLWLGKMTTRPAKPRLPFRGDDDGS